MHDEHHDPADLRFVPGGGWVAPSGARLHVIIFKDAHSGVFLVPTIISGEETADVAAG